ncbi:hypothetical protein MJ547_04190, partial [Burkholderia gladioli]
MLQKQESVVYITGSFLSCAGSADSAPTIGSFKIGTDDKELVRKVLDENPSVLRGLMDTTNAGLFHVPVSPQRVIQTIEGVRAMGIPLDGLDALFTELSGDVLHDTVSDTTTSNQNRR